MVSSHAGFLFPAPEIVTPRTTLTRRVRRVRNHAALGAASLGAAWALFAAIQSDDPVFRASLATAYVALGLFIITLAFGPYAALRGRRYPVSADIRRDFGIWSALVAIVHVVVGLQVHLRGKMWEYFVRPMKGVLLPRIDPFGVANYTGLTAGLILVALLVTSNDASLRRLGTERWRSVHALVTWGLALTLVHAVTYQFIEKRRWETVVALFAFSAAVVWLRLARSRWPGEH
jgi:methionine sulfoxide reductase heme-binding subunit